MNMNNIKTDERKLEPKDYLIKMFGRVGWICKQCNNFNFETRNKCNRCFAIKNPKTIEEINKKKEDNKKNKKKIKERKTDWLCLNCQNLNYGFRKNCNRCQIQRKEEFPSIYLEPNQKINGNNNIIINISIFFSLKKACTCLEVQAFRVILCSSETSSQKESLKRRIYPHACG